MSEPAALDAVDLSRSYRQAGETITVLQGVELHLPAGNTAALVGISGAGKSTLLHLCGLLERPSSGEVKLFGQPTRKLGDRARTKLRRERVGVVYQFHHLLAEFTAEENVLLPQLLAGVSRKKSLERARDLLATVGLDHRFSHHPTQLSGGEQQRVAIARALANRPGLVLADEPTGNLDEGTAELVFEAFLEALRATGAGALVATHDRRLADRMDRVYGLQSGRLQPLADASSAAAIVRPTAGDRVA